MEVDPPVPAPSRLPQPVEQSKRSLASIPENPTTPVLKRMAKGTQPKTYRPMSAVANRPDPVPVQYSLPTDREVFPPTHRQTEDTLLPAGMAVRGASFLEGHAITNRWSSMSASETIKHLASNELIQTIQQSKSRINSAKAQAAMEHARTISNYSRLSSIETGFLNKITPKALTAELDAEGLDREFRAEAVRFFEDDPMSESDDEESQESEGEGSFRSPGDYAILRRLFDVNGQAFLRRNEHRRDATAAGHRDIPLVNKSHNDMMCYRPAPNSNRRRCRRGNACLCLTTAQKLGQPDIGYIGLEYLTPDGLVAWNARRAKGIPISEEADGPVGYCYHDWKYVINDRLHDALKHKETPPEGIEPFNVIVGEGEYAPDVCWGSVDSTTNMNTGLSGRFPMFLNTFLQYGPKTAEGRSFIYLQEVNSDFQPRLSQANMCLGKDTFSL